MKRFIDEIFESVGFSSFLDFMNALYPLKYKSLIYIIAVPLGVIASFIEQSTGLDWTVYLVLIIWVFLDVWTGTKASVKYRKERFESKKFQRSFVKLAIYTVMISSLHILATRLPVYNVWGVNLNFMEMVYHVMVYSIFTGLLLSLMENLRDMGFKNIAKVLDKINDVVNK